MFFLHILYHCPQTWDISYISYQPCCEIDLIEKVGCQRWRMERNHDYEEEGDTRT